MARKLFNLYKKPSKQLVMKKLLKLEWTVQLQNFTIKPLRSTIFISRMKSFPSRFHISLAQNLTNFMKVMRKTTLLSLSKIPSIKTIGKDGLQSQKVLVPNIKLLVMIYSSLMF